MRLLSLVCLFLLALFNVSSSAPTPNAAPNPKKWKQIDALLAKDRTVMAAELVEEIYQAARRQQDTPEYLRALLYKLRLLSTKEENADEKSIALVESDLKTAKFPARPILHSLLAQLYANYYQHHRYQLYDRTRGVAPTDSGSLATWDAARLSSAIVRHYQASVAEEPQRQQKVVLKDLGYAIRDGDTESRALRPTLYDILVHRAVDGLGHEEYYITKPAAQFRLTKPALLGPAVAFTRLPLTVPPADSLNGQFYALRLLQQLTAFRLTETDNPAALADVDLARLAFVHQQAEFANKDSLYQKALARAAEQYKALPISTSFLLEQATSVQENQPAKARDLALEAERRFPTSRGAKQAEALRRQLETSELSFTTEEVVLPNQPWLLKLDTRNVTRLYARAYRLSKAQVLRQFEQQPSIDFAKTYARTLAAAPAATWVLDVAGPRDYKRHSVQQAGPALPLGHYLVVLGTVERTAAKQQAGAVTAYGQLAVSEISNVQRGRSTANGVEVLVLHRQSGQPLAGVSVLPFTRKIYSYPLRPAEQAQTTGATGLAQLSGNNTPDQPPVVAVLLSRGADSLLVRSTSYYGGYSSLTQMLEQAHRRVFLFTDRAIYRPGQTVFFKGILTETRAGTAQLLSNQALSVRLMDVNNQTVQTLTFTTSDFGSFHGSVVLPTGLLNGNMSLQTDVGSLSFSVEEYKRPTFQVTFEPLKGTPSLGQDITARGLATAYAGQPIDGATVQYRVVRRTIWPLYRPYLGSRYMPQPYPGQAEVEITNGTAQTATDGSFSVTFKAQADSTEKLGGKRWGPGYVFEVTADVTDVAGETRTGQQQLNLGASTLSLQLVVPDVVNQEHVPSLRLMSTNGAGQEVPARGQVRLYRLTPPTSGWRPRLWERPEREGLGRQEFKRQFPLDAYAAEDEESNWARTLVLTQAFDTEKSALLVSLAASLQQQAPGRYALEAAAEGGEPAKTMQSFTLYAPTATTLPVPTPDWFVSLQDSVLPGQSARFVVGSSEAGARVLVEVEAKGKTLQQEWLTLTAGEQRLVAVPVPTDLGETQLYVHATQVHDNRLYSHNSVVHVARHAEPLALSIATFRDKLQPGQKETWRITIHNTAGKAAEAELLATLYDKSLDYFRAHQFQELAFPQPYYPALLGWNGSFQTSASNTENNFIITPNLASKQVYPRLNLWGYSEEERESMLMKEVVENKAFSTAGVRVMIRGNSSLAQPAPMAAQLDEVRIVGNGARQQKSMTGSVATTSEPQADLALIQARQNFQETAFWRPDLRTNDKGEIVLEFQMPEAVTRWQLLALAHDKQLHAGLLRRELVTQKQLQVTPNAPRFFREGDQLRLTAKLSNLTAQPMQGTAQLFLFDARTQQPLEARLVKSAAQLPFDLGANQSAALGWDLAIPETADGQVPLEAITYRVVAQTGSAKKRKSKKQPTFSDGEENTLPVLPNRLLVTEALPLSIIGAGTREFELKKLTSTTSPTRRNYSLTLEMSQNPAWYAVQALPYLMEYPYDCSEQTFSRLYASLLAAKILQSNPRIKPVLAEWQRAAQSGNKQALVSKLEQNQELKNLLLQETPWVREAQTDTERMRRLSELFDEPRLQAETSKALAKLAQLQQSSGAFPWFEKMPADRYITQVLVAGFGKLQKLGALTITQNAQANAILQKALRYLDTQLQQDYEMLRKSKDFDPKGNHLSDVQIQALYARSFWEQPGIAKGAQPAFVYYQQQAAAYWKDQTRYLQAQLALALYRQKAQPAASTSIMTALRENALHSEELGMYWKDVRGGYYWREAPTETQATLIEAFDEIADDQKAVDEMKLWLLRQKQTRNWPSTRATADACYALLLRGSDWLQPSQPITVALGGKSLQPSAGEAGTGYFSATLPAAEVKPTQGRVSVTKPDTGLAWGALYWQYFEQLDKITPAATPLSLERQLFREQRTAGGPVLEKLAPATPLRVGDVLVVRLVLRSDRDLEYVHLKDQRAAGLELINQLSGYRYQSGLGYYESPRDAATNFFIGYFPKGTHTFEYRLRAAQSGSFSGGLSQLQCLYAPEFTAHSAGVRLEIAR